MPRSSEPVKPITFYIGRGVPERWRPYFKKGVEAWQPAFEKAGFKNAIIAKDAPSVQEDPTWDAEDARISSIRWLPSTTENAMGPHVNDPRTGEILESDIIFYHNVMKLARDWYFVQASPNDERAQTLPLPDDIMGELLAYIVAHEVGHTLGFPHNMKASSTYTTAQLRDAEFTKKYGTEASIMDYGRFNYVAQPGDGAHLIPVIGPYDEFAVEWGYRSYANEKQERASLASLVAKQKQNPLYRFGNPNPAEDPSQQTEDLGADALESTRLGLLNLERVMGYLVAATCKEGEDYDLLQNMYEQVLAQRSRELGHVANIVGGVQLQNLFFGDADRRYFPVSENRQREAVAFLAKHAFQIPAWLVPTDVLWRLEASGTADRILSSQKRVLRSLLSESRLKRMSDLEALEGVDKTYTASELLHQVGTAIFSELGKDQVQVDLYRRNLQRALVDTFTGMLETEDTQSDLPALARGELKRLEFQIGQQVAKAMDLITQRHLEDLLARCRKATHVEGVNGLEK